MSHFLACVATVFRNKCFNNRMSSLIQQQFSEAHSSGQIQVIFGPMFSGKTTELIRRLRRFQAAKYKCFVIKYEHDVRLNVDGLTSHDRQVLPATSATQLLSLIPDAMKHDVIGIDEGQFFPDCVEFSETMANHGKIVVVAALDGNFKREGFGDILNLVPLAENVVKLTSICMVCHKEAAFSKRTSAETDLVIIGGAEKYMSVCRECHRTSASQTTQNT